MVVDRQNRLSGDLMRGVVEHCVLALIRDGDAYAYDIVRRLGDRALVTTEGTIYPLLARLRRDGLVTTEWRESNDGPPRRYYRLTEDGGAALAAFADAWSKFRAAVDGIVAEPVGGARHGR